MANAFDDDNDCVALFNMESGALTTDSKGTNTLTNNGVDENTSDYKQGSCAGDFEAASTEYFDIDQADLDSGFPFKYGETNYTLGLCLWVYFNSLPGEDTGMAIIAQYDSWFIDRTWRLDLYNDSGTYKWRLVIAWGVGSDEIHILKTGVETGRWYHVGIYFKGDNPYDLYSKIWDDTAESATEHSDTPTTGPTLFDTPLNIGAKLNPGAVWCLDGILDEVVFFNAEINESKIDQIRMGIYGLEALEASASDQLEVISDSLTELLKSKLSEAFIDSLQVIQDSINYSLHTHLTGTVSDTAEVITDEISKDSYGHFSASASDELEPVEDEIGSGSIDLAGTGRWVAPLRITPQVSGISPLYLAAHPVRHPTIYFQPKIKSYGYFDRAISAPAAFIRTGDARITVIDSDNEIRRTLGTKTIRKATAELRLGPEGGSYNAFLRPLKREVGLVTQPGDGLLSFSLRDSIYDALEKEIDPYLGDERYPNLPETPASDFAPIIVGVVNAENGALPLFLVNTVSNGYIVARHPCKKVTVYRKRADEDSFSVATDYNLDNNGHCIINFSSDQEGAQIRANVEGYVGWAGSYGDDLQCTNFADFIKEILLTVMDVDTSLDRLNLASFEDVATKTEADGLVCAGAIRNRVTFAEVLSQLQRSSNIDIFSDKNDRLTVHYTTDDEEASIHLSDLQRLYGGSVRQQLAEPTYNQIPYLYSPNFATNKWEEDTWDNAEDQTAMGGEIVAEQPVYLHWIRDEDQAVTVIDKRGQWLDLHSFRFEGRIPLIPVLEDLELAKLVSIEHFGGIKVGGYTAEQFKILELSMDVDRLGYNFKGIRRRLPPPSLVDLENDGSLTVTQGGSTSSSDDGDISPGVPITDGTARTNSRVGPFSTDTDGELFAVFNGVADPTEMHVWKTTDYGQNWSEADASNAPQVPNDIGSFDSCLVEGVLYIATQETATGRVAYHTFTLSTATWGTTNEQVIASCTNGSDPCVSIECRFPGGEPLIYFQGDKENKSGVYYDRGYYSIKQSGSWSAAVQVTPDPYEYDTDAYGPNNANCQIERVIAGRENRIHFFWNIDPSVRYVRWSPDEYSIPMDGSLNFGTVKELYISGIHYPAPRNIGDPCHNTDRTRFAIIRKHHWGNGAIEIYTEGPSITLATRLELGGIIYNSWTTYNPAGFVRYVDGTYYVGQSEYLDPRYISLKVSEDDGASFPTEYNADEYYSYPITLYNLLGTIVTVRGVQYMASFTDPEDDFPLYRWVKISDLTAI